MADIKDRIDPNDLVYNFKGNENKSKDFGNYQLSLILFDDLKDGDINPKEVVKNHARFKSDLSEIEIDGNKSVNQKNTIKNITPFFHL